MGKPSQEDEFKKYISNGIDVYLKKDIKSKTNKIEISLGKFLWKKHLNVEGISVF